MEEDVVFDNTDASNLEKKFSKKSKNNFEEFV
jgi:hypothetical protein